MDKEEIKKLRKLIRQEIGYETFTQLTSDGLGVYYSYRKKNGKLEPTKTYVYDPDKIKMKNNPISYSYYQDIYSGLLNVIKQINLHLITSYSILDESPLDEIKILMTPKIKLIELLLTNVQEGLKKIKRKNPEVHYKVSKFVNGLENLNNEFKKIIKPQKCKINIEYPTELSNLEVDMKRMRGGKGGAIKRYYEFKKEYGRLLKYIQKS